MELLFGGLPKHMTEESLRSCAEQYGNVVDCKITAQRVNSAEGLVTYSTLEEAAYAWSKKASQWMGVKKASVEDLKAALKRLQGSEPGVGGPVFPAPPPPALNHPPSSAI